MASSVDPDDILIEETARKNKFKRGFSISRDAYEKEHKAIGVFTSGGDSSGTVPNLVAMDYLFVPVVTFMHIIS